MVCQCRFICGNKCITLVGDVGLGGTVHECGQGVYGKSLCIPGNCAVNCPKKHLNGSLSLSLREKEGNSKRKRKTRKKPHTQDWCINQNTEDCCLVRIAMSRLAVWSHWLVSTLSSCWEAAWKPEIIILKLLREQEIWTRKFHWIVRFTRRVDLPNRRTLADGDIPLSWRCTKTFFLWKTPFYCTLKTKSIGRIERKFPNWTPGLTSSTHALVIWVALGTSLDHSTWYFQTVFKWLSSADGWSPSPPFIFRGYFHIWAALFHPVGPDYAMVQPDRSLFDRDRSRDGGNQWIMLLIDLPPMNFSIQTTLLPSLLCFLG